VDLGTDLREARERAGFSLSDLAARTRIPLSSLRAIEQNNFAKVPPGIFVRSFIRSYAQEVGVDPVAAVAEYRAMAEPIEEPPPDLQKEQTIDRMELGSYLPDFAESRPGWGYALIVAAMLVAVIGINRQTPRDASSDTTAAAEPAATASLEDVRPVATTGTAAGLRIDMRTQGACWVKVVVDGRTALARELRPGETHSLSAQRDIVIRVGDPASFIYSVNGRPGQPLGAANVPVTVRVGADGQISRVS
jgi:cytoskeletal protein RodZ